MQLAAQILIEFEVSGTLRPLLLTISDRRMVNDFDYVYDPTLTGNNYIQNGALGANGFINPAGGPPGAYYNAAVQKNFNLIWENREAIINGEYTPEIDESSDEEE